MKRKFANGIKRINSKYYILCYNPDGEKNDHKTYFHFLNMTIASYNMIDKDIHNYIKKYARPKFGYDDDLILIDQNIMFDYSRSYMNFIKNEKSIILNIHTEIYDDKYICNFYGHRIIVPRNFINNFDSLTVHIKDDYCIMLVFSYENGSVYDTVDNVVFIDTKDKKVEFSVDDFDFLLDHCVQESLDTLNKVFLNLI